MNRSIVKTTPAGKFEEISIHMPEWPSRFETLVSERKLIRYDVYTMPNLSAAIQRSLEQQGYVDLILETNHDLHFLVPRNHAN